MQHKHATEHGFFRLEQTRLAIQNRITSLVCLNARKLTMFRHTIFVLNTLKYLDFVQISLCKS